MLAHLPFRRPILVTAGAALLLTGPLSCFIVTKVGVHELPAGRALYSQPVGVAVKVHLLDGSTVVYPRGMTVDSQAVRGDGVRFALDLTRTPEVGPISLDSIVGAEAYDNPMDVPKTLLASAVGTALIGALTAGLLVAVFGSCPTFYSDSAGTPVLEAEGFSYSIAPLFEQRDVDRLGAKADAQGRVSLDVRNEALETHYLNHLEVLAVTHARDEEVAPDSRGVPVALRGLTTVRSAKDRAGRDVSGVLARSDGAPFASDSNTTDNAKEGDLVDWIDLDIPIVPGADSVALSFRLRNSLLNTVLLYDGMLGNGARALQWMSRDLAQLSTAVEMGRWYAENMGLRLAVRDGSAWRVAARLGDSGPVADHEVSAILPVVRESPVATSMRVRLLFTVDNWRIDRVAVASAWRRPATSIVAAGRVVGSDGREDQAALAGLGAPDDRYLQTTPGQRFHITFDAGIARPDSARTFLLASQGYYTEWIRGAWLKPSAQSASNEDFTPSDATMLTAIKRWRGKQVAFEKQFFATKIPVR